MDLLKESEDIIIFKYDGEGLDLEEYMGSLNVSGRLFRKLYKNKKIFVNENFQRKNLALNKGDIITLQMEEEEENTSSEKMELDIVYEDFDVLILNKGPNIVVHPTKSHQANTLSNGISYYFKEKGIKKKIRFVNRLDMDTTGLLIVAKNPFAHQQMAIQFENDTVVKKYLAIVDGVVKDDEGTIDLPIGREEEGSIKKEVTQTGQEALTKFKVIERYESTTLLEVRIYTGRSHQIRVHLNHIGHPIIGDSLYNEKHPIMKRQALHSYYLKALLPRHSNEKEFKAQLPIDMNNFINLMKY